MRELQIKQIKTTHQNTTIIDNISVHLKAGEIGCLLGPSGCGKTTLLRSIAGLQKLTEGEIYLGDQLVSSNQFHLAIEKRKVGMVFQDYALFPHMNIADNIRFGIEHQSRKQQQDRIHQLLELVNLAGKERRYPHELSGGQQQRVALARALAAKPQILLMDEPFSGLDVELRESLARQVRCILKTEGITALMVTHNQNEAFAIADSVGVMKDGELLQWDTPYNLYHQPNYPFIADFIGQGVLIKGSICGCRQVHTELGVLNTQLAEDHATGEKVSVLVRPDDIIHSDKSSWQLEVVSRVFRGSHFLFTLKLPNDEQVMCMSQSHHDHAVGSKIGIKLEMDHAVVFPLQNLKKVKAHCCTSV
ncbi:MAG: iron(III) transport system ATP-binding protein [Thiomicrorhabdus sp.]|nr:MAG: iron(III) transport system ATP-binding protein [Thiomicrorhabdus sp.]